MMAVKASASGSACTERQEDLMKHLLETISLRRCFSS